MGQSLTSPKGNDKNSIQSKNQFKPNINLMGIIEKAIEKISKYFKHTNIYAENPKILKLKPDFDKIKLIEKDIRDLFIIFKKIDKDWSRNVGCFVDA